MKGRRGARPGKEISICFKQITLRQVVFILRTKVMLTTVRGQLQIAAKGLPERVNRVLGSGVLPKYQSNDGGTWEGPAQKSGTNFIRL